MKSAETARVYVMEDEGDDTVKVGCATDVGRRWGELSFNGLFPISTVYTSSEFPTKQAFRAERIAHRLLDMEGIPPLGRERKKGLEWFETSAAVATSAVKRAERIMAGEEPEPPKKKMIFVYVPLDPALREAIRAMRLYCGGPLHVLSQREVMLQALWEKYHREVKPNGHRGRNGKS